MWFFLLTPLSIAEMRSLAWMAALAAVAYAATTPAAKKDDDLDCMFLGYPELEYDGYDRTEVSKKEKRGTKGLKSTSSLMQRNCV